ncbi:MAG: DUF456 family protein [Planctomycetota bacterium]
MQWVGMVVMDLGLVLALLTVPLALPGIWVMVAIVSLGTWAGLQPWGWEFVGFAVATGLLSEVLEHILSWTGVLKAGGTKAEAWGAFLGSFIGGLLGSLAIPIPVLGSLAGLLVGAFLGAFAAGAHRARKERLELSWRAAWARALSLAVKTAGALAILAGTVAAQVSLLWA